MSLLCPIGPESNILEPNEFFVHRLFLDQPILSLYDLEVLKKTNYRGWKAQVVDCTYPKSEGPNGLLKTLDRVCKEAEAAARAGYHLIVLSDRQAGPERYIPFESCDNFDVLPINTHYHSYCTEFL